MITDLVTRALVGLLPVLCFLAVLLYLDSYKLVAPRVVIQTIVIGALTAGASYLIHINAIELLSMELRGYSRYVAPVVEEALKGAVLVYLIRTNRIGFLVDAAIFGFAVGTGFAMVENLYYLRLIPDAHLGVWIVRGFGTAIMHGGASAIFAITAQVLAERSGRAGLRQFLPGFVVAVVLHSLFNHFFLSPILSTFAILLVLPPVIYFVLQRSERAMSDWLGTGFDADTELLELINSGSFSESPVGRYLHELKDRFRGDVVVDLICYLRLHTELALRAKGVLMMRENGFDVPVGERTRAKFEEMKYLEKSIGKTGRLAMQPFLHMDRKDLWQLYMLGK